MCIMKKNNTPLPPLTAKEKAVLQFIEAELLDKGISPSYQEICDRFGFASFNSVQNYLKQLSNKGYVQIQQNQKRAIQLLHSTEDFQKSLVKRLQVAAEPSHDPLHSSFLDQSSKKATVDHSKVLPTPLLIPLLGRVAAGLPIERVSENEFIEIPKNLVKNTRDLFALVVEGDSMIDEGIMSGDTLIIQTQKIARDGDLIVASIEQEATVKRFFHKVNSKAPDLGKQIELRPANSKLTSMWYQPSQVEIKGLVKALIRSY